MTLDHSAKYHALALTKLYYIRGVGGGGCCRSQRLRTHHPLAAGKSRASTRVQFCMRWRVDAALGLLHCTDMHILYTCLGNDLHAPWWAQLGLSAADCHRSSHMQLLPSTFIAKRFKSIIFHWQLALGEITLKCWCIVVLGPAHYYNITSELKFAIINTTNNIIKVAQFLLLAD